MLSVRAALLTFRLSLYEAKDVIEMVIQFIGVLILPLVSQSCGRVKPLNIVKLSYFDKIVLSRIFVSEKNNLVQIQTH